MANCQRNRYIITHTTGGIQPWIKLQLGNIFQKKQIFVGIFENILQSIFYIYTGDIQLSGQKNNPFEENIISKFLQI